MKKNEVSNKKASLSAWVFGGESPLPLQKLEYLVKALFICIYIVGTILVWRHKAFLDAVLYSTIIDAWCENFFLCYVFISTIVLIILFLLPIGRGIVHLKLHKIGMVNYIGETPIYLYHEKDKDTTNVEIWYFSAKGISLKEWLDKKDKIETIFNVIVVDIKNSLRKDTILLYTMPVGTALPTYIEWKNKYLQWESFVLVLGRGYKGLVTVNLTKIPHILLGGSTGSGKSILLKSLLIQALKKDAIVYIADFKGGVDFTADWCKGCNLCFDEKYLIGILSQLVKELESRKDLFRKTGCSNIDEYNKRDEAYLQRYIFACDEVAEILDKTGLSKEQKEVVNQIEGYLSTIARQGRAFGIHLILATQRPDANILSGQIKNNMDCRICGRADKVLSQIILDNSDGADTIPKDIGGRFLMNDGKVFQGFFFDESI